MKSELSILTLLAATAVYFSSQCVRSLKFWFIYYDPKVSMRLTFLVIYTTGILGCFFPIILGEIIRIVVLGLLLGNVARVFMTDVVSRMMDLFCLGTILLILCWQGVSLDPQVKLLGIATLGVVCMALLLLSGSDKILLPLKRVIVRRAQRPWEIAILKAIDSIQVQQRNLGVNSPSLVGLSCFFSIISWSLDVWAFSLLQGAFDMTEKWGLLKAAEVWAVKNLTRLITPTPTDVFSFEKLLYQPQVAIALLCFFFSLRYIRLIRTRPL